MDNNNNDKSIDLQELINIKVSFENSMKIMEKNIAESVTNKKKLDIMKKDLIEVKEKFSEAEKFLMDLKIKLRDKK
jgi:hypothetical protein